MSNTETVIQEQQDAAPSELPADSPSVPVGTTDDRSLDDLLAEWDAVHGKQAEPEPIQDQPSADLGAADSTLDQQLQDILGPNPKIAELQGQIDAFRSSEFQAQERPAAEQWAGELQDALVRSNPNLEDSFVMDRLKILAAENPGVLEAAWQYRNLTNADLAQAQREYRSAEVLYQQVLAQPDTEPRKQNALRHLEQRGAQLQAMLGSRQVIRNVRNEIRKRAESKLPPLDPIASEDRAAIVASVIRDGLGPANIPEPPVNWGRLSGKEFREKVIRDHGFDPGTW